MQEFRPPSVIATDTELARSFSEGDEGAVRTLYDRYGGLVYTVSLRILGDRQRAEEATQQTFLQAWRNSESLEEGRDFAPWLATIARRAAIDLQRNERRRPADSIETSDIGDSSLMTLPPDAATIETVWTVRRAIEALEPHEREIVQLQHLEGFSHSQIADRLGIAIGTVKSRSFRAHRRLSRRLAHLRESDTT